MGRPHGETIGRFELCCRIRVNSTSICTCFVLWEICPLSDACLLSCNHFVARTLGTPDPRTTSSLVRTDRIHPCPQQTGRVFTLHSPEPPVATAPGIIGSEQSVHLRHCRRCYSGSSCAEVWTMLSEVMPRVTAQVAPSGFRAEIRALSRLDTHKASTPTRIPGLVA